MLPKRVGDWDERADGWIDCVAVHDAAYCVEVDPAGTCQLINSPATIVTKLLDSQVLRGERSFLPHGRPCWASDRWAGQLLIRGRDHQILDIRAQSACSRYG